MWYDGHTFESKLFTFNILDRVGGGDAFASGLIYAMLHDYKAMDMINFAVASSAIKHTIHGDGINSHYDDLYRIPDGGVIQVDYPDGRSFTARVKHLDDYHFDMGGLGNVFHICQFAEVMERNHANFYPEIQTQDEQAAWELGGKGYLAIQSCEDGWDYTIYHSDYSVMDGGQLDAPELTIQEAREQILVAHHLEKGRRLLQDYDAVMDKVAEAEELSADHRPSTLEKLAELASDTSAPKSSARSAPEL